MNEDSLLTPCGVCGSMCACIHIFCILLLCGLGHNFLNWIMTSGVVNQMCWLWKKYSNSQMILSCERNKN